MSYDVTDHGTWKPYTPSPLPEWAQGVMSIGGPVAFLRRTSDGMDFYDFRATDPFAENAVVAATLPDPGTNEEIVKSVFRDPGMIFPTNQRLIEIVGVDPSITDPHNLFTEQLYDPTARTFSPLPPFTPTACSKLGLKRAFGDQWPRVRAAIAADPDTQEEWDLATQVNRADPLVAKVQAALGLTDDQVTDLIRRAVALVQPAP